MPVRNHRDDLLERLFDPDYATQYFKAALDETLSDGDIEVLQLAFENIVDATKFHLQNKGYGAAATVSSSRSR